MSRIRSVHPGLFTDEAWVSCSPLARILVMGLWTEADDQGVFEWKPLQIKMRVLPADAADVPILLQELASADLVRRFESGGKQFGAIRNFRKFQRPKKPNAIHPFPEDIRAYVAINSTIDDDGGEPVPNLSPTASEKSPQMEDGGGRREEEKEATQPASAARPVIDSLASRLLAAAGRAVADPIKHPGILALSDPLNWIENGCDMDLDIVPTIAAKCARAPPGKYRSWSYFSPSVFEARDKRLKPPPEPIDEPTGNRGAPQQRKLSNGEQLVSGLARALEKRGAGGGGGQATHPAGPHADIDAIAVDVTPGREPNGITYAGSE